MASTHINARPKHKLTQHEQKQAMHHATHPEHRGEELGKHRTQGHNGTHPVKISHHSGNHVSNPNVHHTHAVNHSEAITALNEKLKKTASSAVTKGKIPTTAYKPHLGKTPVKTISKGTKPTTPGTHPTTPTTSSRPKAVAVPNPNGPSIQDVISANQKAVNAYNNSHPSKSSGTPGVSTPHVYDYSQGWTKRTSVGPASDSYNQTYPSQPSWSVQSVWNNVHSWLANNLGWPQGY